MLIDRLRASVEPLLVPGEGIRAAMAGFRPVSRSMALVAAFPLVFLGFAAGAAAGWPAWVGGALGAATGAGVAMWLDQRRARAEHGGKGMSIGLVVTTDRLFVLELDTGPISATVADVEKVAGKPGIEIATEKMQGSGLKRLGVVLTFDDGEVLRVIPARTEHFLQAMAEER